MRLYGLYALLIGGVVCIAACSSSKTIEKSPVETFVMPCSDWVSGDGALRAWASGKSDNEMSARKKAQMSAASDLAAMLGRIVGTLVEDKSAIVSEKDAGISKSLFIEKATLSVKQTLKGAVIVCDQWTKDETSGQYTNYIVLELRGDEYLKNLYKSLGEEASVSVDKKLLEDLFDKLIDESGSDN